MPRPSPSAAKPRTVTAVQLLQWSAALPPLVFLWLVQTYNEHFPGYMAFSDAETLDELLTSAEFLPSVLMAVAAVALLTVLPTVSTIGLGRGRRSSRVLSLVWLGAMILPAGFWTAVTVILYPHSDTDLYGPSIELGVLGTLIVAACSFTASTTAFIMLCTRPVREWTATRHDRTAADPVLQDRPQDRR